MLSSPLDKLGSLIFALSARFIIASLKLIPSIFVKKVINEEIIKTLEMCNKEDYFEYLKPCELNENNELKYEFSEKFVLFLKENKLYKSLKIENLILIYSN